MELLSCFAQLVFDLLNTVDRQDERYKCDCKWCYDVVPTAE